ncbi:MAG: hypothetical protein ACHQAY_12715 [Hyphomicrobiales bacterium]
MLPVETRFWNISSGGFSARKGPSRGCVGPSTIEPRGAFMPHVPAARRSTELRARLTDIVVIATQAESLRVAGYTELAIWRHFLEAFIVDLDALSLIIAELFGKRQADGEPGPAASAQGFGYHQAA